MGYLDGINQYMEEGLSHRVSVGRCRKKNSPLKMFIIFWIHVFSFAMAHKTDPLLTDIRNKYGMEYLKDFGLDELNTTLIKNAKENPEEF
jgi:penicillin amidase